MNTGGATVNRDEIVSMYAGPRNFFSRRVPTESLSSLVG